LHIPASQAYGRRPPSNASLIHAAVDIIESLHYGGHGNPGTKRARAAVAACVWGFAFWLAACSACAQSSAVSAREIFERAVTDFENGRIAESAAGFDRVAALDPAGAPHLWQRGIALYYAGRYADCRAQFESHRTVNPDDVENAAWHFLCVARLESPQKARAALLPVGPDSRVPMREIYQMFRGAIPPAQVLREAGVESGPQFYAQLYVGLYYEALGDQKRALEHLTIAAQDRYEGAGYMHTVARVHVGLLRRR
jgi:lipoprotein NlpI